MKASVVLCTIWNHSASTRCEQSRAQTMQRRLARDAHASHAQCHIPTRTSLTAQSPSSYTMYVNFSSVAYCKKASTNSTTALALREVRAPNDSSTEWETTSRRGASHISTAERCHLARCAATMHSEMRPTALSLRTSQWEDIREPWPAFDDRRHCIARRLNGWWWTHVARSIVFAFGQCFCVQFFDK